MAGVENIKLSTQVRLPIELYVQVEAVAQAKNQSSGRYIAEMVAKAHKFALPAEQEKASKYASPEEKKAAGQKRRDERRTAAQTMLARLKAELAAATGVATPA